MARTSRETPKRYTAAQVAKRFGVAQLTFYRRRGPVRSDALKRRSRRGPGRPPGSGSVPVDPAARRNTVRERVRKLLPQIVREEVAAALKLC